MSFDQRPHAVINAAGIRAFGAPPADAEIPGVVYLRPAAGVHVEVHGQEAGSLHVASRITGALSSDWQGFRYKKAGVFRWTHGSNMEGDGADEWTLIRNEPGDDQVAVRIKRNLEARFAGALYSGGVLVANASTTWAASAITTGVFNPARLGSNTPDDTKYLRGDGAWRPLSEIEGSGGGDGSFDEPVVVYYGTGFNPSLKIRNLANTISTFEVYGYDGTVKMGNWAVAKHTLNSVTAATMFDKVRSQDGADGGNGGANTMAIIGIGAGIACISNVGSILSGWGGAQHYGDMGLSADGGMRMNQNVAVNGTTFEHGRPSSRFGMESDGNFEYRWWQPLNSGAPPYSGSGKCLIIAGPGRLSDHLTYTNKLSIMLMQGGRDMEFCTSKVNDDAKPGLTITGHEAPGDVQIHRGLVLLQEGNLVPAIYFYGSGTPSTMLDGGMWRASGQLKYREGGVTYNIDKTPE